MVADQLIPTPTRQLARHHHSSARWLQILLDQSVVIGLLILHTLYKVGSFPEPYRFLAIVVCLLMALVYTANGVYHYRASLFDRFLNLLRAWVTVIILLVVGGFVTKTSEDYSREVLLIWSFTALIGQFGAYLFVSFMQTSAKNDQLPTLLIGARSLGRHLATHINTNKWIPDQIVGVIEDDDLLKTQWDLKTVPVLGNLEDIHKIIASHGIRRVYIALPMQHANLVKPIYLGLVEKNVDVIWAPDIFGVSLLNHSIHEVAGVPLISLSETPMIGSSAFVKSLMDVSIAATGIAR
jgi:putative colanic acid biosynthesis UDP-glucose lipid carrier transferase